MEENAVSFVRDKDKISNHKGEGEEFYGNRQ